MKAVIADDEIWVCKLIEKLIDWDNLGIKIVAEVDNGIDAYNAILNEKPYIVITDIRMPGIDGLELIKKVRESGIETNFIIISGHKQFEYAQNAVKYGVEDYLLKPINREELLNILIKLRDRYFINNKKLEEEMMIRKQLTYNIGRIRKQFLYNILLNINNVEDADINRINNEYNFNFKPGKFQGIILKVDKKSNEDINENYENIILNKLCEIVKKHSKEICEDIETINFNKRVVCILNYSEEKSNLIKKIYKNIFEDIKNYLEIQEHFYLTMAFGLVAYNIKFIPNSLKSALDLINCRAVLGIGKILDASNFNLGCVDISELLTLEKEKSFTNYIESFDKKGIETWINDFFNSVRFKIEEDPLMIFKGYNKIIEIFFDTMKKTDFQYEDYTKEKIYKKIDSCKNLNEIVMNIVESLNECLEMHLQYKKSQENKPIRVAKQYISKNYKRDITLEDISNEVHLNPVYFSVIFKKEVGMNFSEYLINYRIDIAKELLKNKNYNICQIADMVGYKDSKYFSKLFAKVVGIKPLEYRKLYS